MRCRKCGAEIREGSLYCDMCGEEVRIVPDYSSLDEILAEHVRNELQSGNRTKKTTGRPKKKSRKHHKKMILILSSLLFIILIGLLLYQTSYAGYIKRGYNALDKKKYDTAIRRFESAIEKDEKRADGYSGMADVYLAKKDFYSAEKIFLDEIERQESNVGLYKGLIRVYMKSDKKEEIPKLLEECKSDSVLSALSGYIVETPSFSLTKDSYDNEQELKLYSNGNDIYYTLDGSTPTESSGAKYRKDTPILLGEREWVVRAVAVNKKGIPSLLTKHTYKIQTPTTEAPIVSPSSGLYEQQEKITIQVKEGFTAYYAFGTTEPTEENWKKYIGPIPMPQGNLIFSAVLVENSTGKASAITVRNYDLELDTQTEENIQQ